MKRKIVALTAVSLASAAFADNWDNSSGNAQWSTATNWVDNTEPTIADFALFPNTIPGGQSTITLSSGEFALSLTFLNSYTLTGGNIQLGNGTITLGGFSPTISSVIAGTGPITFSGGGTLSLFPVVANSYTGGTIISGSSTTVVIRTNGALGFNTAPVTLNGGRLRYDGSVNPTFLVSRPFTIGTGGGTIDLQNGAIVRLLDALAATANTLTLTGTGSAQFDQSSARTGNTTINGPTGRLMHALALGTGTISVFNGGVLELGNTRIYDMPTFLGGGGSTMQGGTGASTYNGSCNVFGPSVTLNGGPAASDTLIMGTNGASVWNNGVGVTTTVNSGVVRLQSANAYAGDWLLSGGSLQLDHPDGFGTGTTPVVVGAAGILALNTPSLARDIALNRRVDGVRLLRNTTLTGHVTCPDFGPSLVVVPFVGNFDVTLTGPGSSFNTVNAVSIGDGSGKSLRVLSGAQVTSETVFLSGTSASPGVIQVSGTGSAWNCSSFFQVAQASTGSLAIEAGGTVSADTFFAGAYLDIGDVASATITGAGSTLTCTNTLWAGYTSFGTGGTASLSVLNGGSVTSGAGIVGSGDTDTTATVSGIGSTWNVLNLLEVGQNTGSLATLNVANSGTLSCAGLFLGNGTNASATLSVSGQSHFDCGPSGIIMSQGGATSTLNLPGGIVDINGNITDAGPGVSSLIMDGSTLDMHGFSIGGASPIDSLQFRSGTLKNVADINNGQGLHKTGPGTLYLNTPNTYVGPTVVTQGTLFLANSTGSATGIGLLTVFEGATLAGPGQAGSLVQNFGVVAPAGFNANPIGTLTLTNTFSQFSTGTLRIDIGGAGLSDRLAITGPAAIAAGTLDVQLVNGYQPIAGDSFTILTASSVSGQFPTTNFPALPGGLQWQVAYSANQVQLRVVAPCPADIDNDGDFLNGMTPDGGVDVNDLIAFLGAFGSGDPAADLDNGSGSGITDGGVDINDLLFFLSHFEGGC